MKKTRRIARAEAARMLSRIVYPHDETRINRVQASMTHYIKSGLLPKPPWDWETLLSWVSYMAKRDQNWARAAKVYDLPEPLLKRKDAVALGAIEPVVLPQTLEDAAVALSKALRRVRELEPIERRYRRDVANGKQGGRGKAK